MLSPDLRNKSVPSRRLSLSLGPKYLAIFFLQLSYYAIKHDVFSVDDNRYEESESHQ